MCLRVCSQHTCCVKMSKKQNIYINKIKQQERNEKIMKTLRCSQYVIRLVFAQWCRCVFPLLCVCACMWPIAHRLWARRAPHKWNEKDVTYFFLCVYNNIKTTSTHARTQAHPIGPIWHATHNWYCRGHGWTSQQANNGNEASERANESRVSSENGTRTNNRRHQKVCRKIYFSTKSKYAYTTRDSVS